MFYESSFCPRSKNKIEALQVKKVLMVILIHHLRHLI